MMNLGGDVLLWYLSTLDTDAIVERTREQVARELPPERMGATDAERDAYWHGVRTGAAIVRDALLSFVHDQAGAGEDALLH